jgi:hypothetical protein
MDIRSWLWFIATFMRSCCRIVGFFMHRHFRPYLFALSIGYVLTGTLAAQEIDKFLPKMRDRCAGDLEKRHQGDPPWDFTTNSRLPTPEQPTSYLHCIFNNDPKNVLDVDWLIPMVKQPIPAKSSAISPRYSDGPPLGRPDGCLIFGNLRDKSLKAQFWARPEDKDRVVDEDGKDCFALKSASAKPERSKASKRADSVAPFRVFLRSNLEPNSALVAFEGITGLRMKDTNVYESFVSYRLRNEKDEPPLDMAGFTMAPRWVGPVELISNYYSSVYKEPIKLVSQKDPTNVGFLVKGADDWELHELEYLVRDRNGRIAASFFSPVYAPPPR